MKSWTDISMRILVAKSVKTHESIAYIAQTIVVCVCKQTITWKTVLKNFVYDASKLGTFNPNALRNLR